VSVSLVIQHVKRMRRVILPSVATPALQYFFTLSHKQHDFRGEGGVFSAIFVQIITHCKNSQARYCHRCS